MSDIAHLAPSRREVRRAAPPEALPVPPAPRSRQRPLRVAVIGEFNSGKTTLVNALAGAPVLPCSFTTHTAYPTVLKFARRPSLAAELAQRRRVPFEWEQLEAAPTHHIHRLHVGMPLDRLRSVRVIDTPGLDQCDELQHARTLRACRRADAVIWCTPAMQAWKASEHQTWLAMPKAVRRRGILAVTFVDLLRSQSDAARLMARLHADAGHLFQRIVATSGQGLEPELMDVDALVDVDA